MANIAVVSDVEGDLLVSLCISRGVATSKLDYKESVFMREELSNACKSAGQGDIVLIDISAARLISEWGDDSLGESSVSSHAKR